MATMFKMPLVLPCEAEVCRFPRRRMPWHAKEGTYLNGSFYCCLDCLEDALRKLFQQPRTVSAFSGSPHRMPLGLLLLSSSIISADQLRTALDRQRSSGSGRLGRHLLDLGAVSESDVTAMIARQWSCPVFKVADRLPSAAQMVPAVLARHHRAVPVHYLAKSQTLYVAFDMDIDRLLLYSIEQMLSCRTEPCIVSSSWMDKTLDELSHESRANENVIESGVDLHEAARVVRSFVAQLGSEEVQSTTIRSTTWIRMRHRHGEQHLLFPFLTNPTPYIRSF